MRYGWMAVLGCLVVVTALGGAAPAGDAAPAASARGGFVVERDAERR